MLGQTDGDVVRTKNMLRQCSWGMRTSGSLDSQKPAAPRGGRAVSQSRTNMNRSETHRARRYCFTPCAPCAGDGRGVVDSIVLDVLGQERWDGGEEEWK